MLGILSSQLPARVAIAKLHAKHIHCFAVGARRDNRLAQCKAEALCVAGLAEPDLVCPEGLSTEKSSNAPHPAGQYEMAKHHADSPRNQTAVEADAA